MQSRHTQLKFSDMSIYDYTYKQYLKSSKSDYELQPLFAGSSFHGLLENNACTIYLYSSSQDTSFILL
jgi:hypothetical protein